MGLFFNKTDANEFPWINLDAESKLEEAFYCNDVIFIFKHSTRCSISKMVKQQFEREWKSPTYKHQLYYLDLLQYRSISNKIEELTGVQHQSPQLIVLKDQKVIYAKSHSSINAIESIESVLNTI